MEYRGLHLRPVIPDLNLEESPEHLPIRRVIPYSRPRNVQYVIKRPVSSVARDHMRSYSIVVPASERSGLPILVKHTEIHDDHYIAERDVDSSHGNRLEHDEEALDRCISDVINSDFTGIGHRLMQSTTGHFKNGNEAGLNLEVPPVAAFEEVDQPSTSAMEFEKKVSQKQYPMTYVERSRRWTFKSSAASLATTDEDGSLYYNPDPYRPAPPAKGAPSTLTRMHYAAQRIDNRKYRAQKSVARATNHMESASCDKCNLRFFLPFNHFRSHVSYSMSLNRFALPETYFRCPMCRKESQILM